MQAASLFTARLDDGRGEYVSFIDDVARMATIQVVMQVLMVAQGTASMGADFFVYLLQLLVGVATYWLVVRRAVAVRSA